MKKAIVTIMALVAFAVTVNAQNALGARINVDGGYGYGAELSFQHGLSDRNRLELDFGWNNHKHYDQIGITGVYQWQFNIVGNLSWFVGVGGNVGIWTSSSYNDFTLSVVGQVGIEYKLDAVPLQFAFDYRPMAYLIFPDDHYSDVDRLHLGALAFSIRYCF